MGGALRYIAVIKIHEALTTDSSNMQMWRTIWHWDCRLLQPEYTRPTKPATELMYMYSKLNELRSLCYFILWFP